MCGIAGLVDRDHRQDAAARAAVAEQMGSSLHHRGPDDGGVEADDAGGVAFAARRLAIVDLSPAGHQPMWSSDGRWLLAYNGELYNTGALREQLEAAGHRFRGHSDTEVLVTALRAWGPRTTLERAVGMFAFAAWDRDEQTLVLARDRFGEKPLYYGWQDGVLRFGSELRALRADPTFRPSLNRDAVALLLRHTYIPAPHSIYEDVHKLPPASFLTWRRGRPADVETYWSLADVARQSQRDPLTTPEAVDEALAPLLGRVVASRLVSDVPLGAFLSGGIDSSLVVALMDEHHDGPVRTFTIGFTVDEFDEAPYAREVARVLGTEHTELYVSPEEAREVIPRLPDVYDEPFADQSQIPTLLLARLAREHVAVALSGDGGDELFGGYHHHGWTIEGLPARRFGRRRKPSPHQVHLDRLASWVDPAAVVRGGSLPPTAFTERVARPPFADPLDWMMEADAVTFLPDDVLVKMDRATMAVSLEGRAPYLDPDVAALAWRIPPAGRMGETGGKQPLRRLLARYVPSELFERPKMGFNLPVADWLREPLAEWAEDLLATVDPDLLDPEPIQQAWAEHRAGADHAYRLWPVLMLQAWKETS